MKFLRNAWYVAMWGEDLSKDKPVQRRILGHPVVLYRSQAGEPIALSDACPHRFAPLHLGPLQPGDRIQCPYHGLQFDRDGRCVHNPHGAGRIPPAAKVRAWPVVERHLAIWIWMGDEVPDPARIPDFSHLDQADPANVSKRDWIELSANYKLVNDNLLDLSHVSFLHDGILGSAETVPAATDVIQEGSTIYVNRSMPNVPIPPMMRLMFTPAIEGGPVDLWMDVRWNVPGCIRNFNGATNPGAPREEGSGIIGSHFMTPIDETSTAYHFCAIRWNARSQNEEADAHIRQQLSELRRYAFEIQDKQIIDAQQSNLLNPAVDTSRPALFEIDAGPVRFARILNDLIAAEDEAAG